MARTYHCSNCGAPNEERARVCNYCRAPIATVRCADCHHMNVPEAIHCSGCGYTLGLEPIYGAADVRCARCRGELSSYRSGAGRLFDCGGCGAQFVEHDLLRQLLERREVAGAFMPRNPRRRNPLEQPVVYLKCPECREVMNRKNFGNSSGIIVDICARHGFWFDAGELPEVLKFVEEGGLARVRHAQRSQAGPARSLPNFRIVEEPPATLSSVAGDVTAAIASVGLGLLALLSGD
ncbi:MAG TPA: zinc ribbon domain-containing protein [Polyangiaceae bacterium]|nr:zinc ribbon domain-containing protein [Polyangiaceae bacterium]